MREMMAVVGLTCVLALAACSDPAQEIAHAGDEQPLNQTQFDFLKAECGLDDASFGTDSFDRPAVVLSEIRSDSEMVQMIVCVKGQFEKLNAEASIKLPDGQMEAPRL